MIFKTDQLENWWSQLSENWRDALQKLVAFTWNYYVDNPELITLVNSENLHKAQHIKNSQALQKLNRRFVDRMRMLLERGATAGFFRSGLDPVQVLITLSGGGFHYLTNHHTGEIVYGRKLMTRQAQAARLQFNTETILRLVCTAEQLLKMEGT